MDESDYVLSPFLSPKKTMANRGMDYACSDKIFSDLSVLSGDIVDGYFDSVNSDELSFKLKFFWSFKR